MRYRELCYRLSHDRCDELQELLIAQGFLAFSAEPVGDDHRLTVYHLDEQPAPLQWLAEAGLIPESDQTHAAEDLWRSTNQASDCEELADGVWMLAAHVSPPTDCRIALRLPPGGGFGDGRHATTRLAARLLIEQPPTGQRVLDLGCGSGVLGVLAHRLGATTVAFSDIDTFAIDHTQRTCALNDLTHAPIWRSDLLAGIPADIHFDLIIANLYGDFLIPLLADPRLHHLTPRLILSGINDSRHENVEKAVQTSGWIITARHGADGWWALAATAASHPLDLPTSTT